MTTVAALEGLLARQKEAIRQGDVVTLTTLSEPMSDYLEQLVRNPAGQDKEPLDRIRHLAEENQRLLGAAIQGVQAAAGRMKDIVGVASELRTYDSQGRQSSVSCNPGAMERRA